MTREWNWFCEGCGAEGQVDLPEGATRDDVAKAVRSKHGDDDCEEQILGAIAEIRYDGLEKEGVGDDVGN